MSDGANGNPLAGKVAIITGGAMGIGRAVAEGLAEDGASVVIADLKNSEAAARDIADGKNVAASGIDTDVSSEQATQAMAAHAIDTYGGVDILVNNAGIFSSLTMEPMEAISTEDWQRVMNVNVMGVWLAAKAVLPAMRERGGGRIVNVASIVSMVGMPYMLHYASSKGAVIGMTHSMARELGRDNINVNAIAPGWTLSDGVKQNDTQIEQLQQAARKGRTIRRDQEQEDLVGAVRFLSGPGSSYITGQSLIVDGGTFMH